MGIDQVKKSWGQGATEGDKVAMWSKSEPSAEGQGDNFKGVYILLCGEREDVKENTGVMRQTEKKAKVYQRIKGVVVSGHSTVACEEGCWLGD